MQMENQGFGKSGKYSSAREYIITAKNAKSAKELYPESKWKGQINKALKGF